MDFTFEKEKDGWALITHASGQQYRIEYNVGDRGLSPGLYLFTSDGFAPESAHQQASHVALTRIETVTDCNTKDVIDTASRFMDAHGLSCIGPDYCAVICEFVRYAENGDWVLKDVLTDEETVLDTVKHYSN